MTKSVIDIISDPEFGYEPPWFYDNPLGLRCELGDRRKSRRAVYKRAVEIFRALFPCGVDALFFDHYIFDKSRDWQNIEFMSPKVLADDEYRILKFLYDLQSFPHKTVENINVERERYDEDLIKVNRCIAEIGRRKFDASPYIKSDLFENAPTVHFVSEENACIYSIYDLRGADVVFFNRQKYREFFDRLRPYLLDYDIEEMISRRDEKFFDPTERLS